MMRTLIVSLAILVSYVRPGCAEMWLGANGHPFSSYPGVSLERQIDYLADLGMKSYRVDINRIGQAGGLANLVALGKEKGIEILPVITPTFDLDAEEPAVLYKQAFALAEFFVTRFKDSIRVWELGNEMENYAIIKPCEMRDDGTQYPCEWGPAGGVGALDYYGPRWSKVSAVLRGLSDGTKSVDPQIRRAMGTAGWGHVGAFERMKADGIEWDISVWHIYGEDPEWAFKSLATYNRPIWITEFNNPYGSTQGEEKQAEGLRAMVVRLRELSGTYNVEAAHIYELMDETYWGDNFEAKMGLVTLVSDGAQGWHPGVPKSAYEIVRTLTGVEGPSRFASQQGFEAANKATDRLSSPKCIPANLESSAGLNNRGRVDYLYCLILDRRSDGAGLDGYVQRIRKGATIESIILDLMGSNEFVSRMAGLSDDAALYIAGIYRILFERPIDGPEFTKYIARINEGNLTRVELLKELLSSEDFKKKHSAIFQGTSGADGRSAAPQRDSTAAEPSKVY